MSDENDVAASSAVAETIDRIEREIEAKLESDKKMSDHSEADSSHHSTVNQSSLHDEKEQSLPINQAQNSENNQTQVLENRSDHQTSRRTSETRRSPSQSAQSAVRPSTPPKTTTTTPPALVQSPQISQQLRQNSPLKRQQTSTIRHSPSLPSSPVATTSPKRSATQPREQPPLKLPQIKQQQQQQQLQQTTMSQQSKPNSGGSLDHLPSSNSSNPKRGLTSNSLDSTDTKKIYRWHLWWEKQHTDTIRVPTYSLPNKNVQSKISSFENIGYKSNGGQVKILNEKPKWNTQSKIDSHAKDYRPGGGNRAILDQKLTWKRESKIGSLENVSYKPGGGRVQIIDQPFDKSGVRPKIDSGLIYEEVFVPADYQVKSTPRPNYYEQVRSETGRSSIRNH